MTESQDPAGVVEAQDVSKRARSGQIDEDTFYADLPPELPAVDTETIRKTVAWMRSNYELVEFWRGKRKSGIVGNALTGTSHTGVPFRITQEGKIEFSFGGWLKNTPPFTSIGRRRRLLKRLNTIKSISIREAYISETRTVPISTIADDLSLMEFLRVFEWCLDEIKEAHENNADEGDEDGGESCLLN